MPFFSIVTPTYNRFDTIQKTIDSVLCQSFKDFEFIVVDDGSTDKTSTLFDKIEDQRVRYYWKENGERNSARNYGIRKAIGEYIILLDSDDLLQKGFLQHVHSCLIEKNRPEIFHARFNVVDESGNVLDERPEIDEATPDKLLFRNYFACNFVLRRDIALANPYVEIGNLLLGKIGIYG